MYISSAKTAKSIGNLNQAVMARELDYNFPNTMYIMFMRKDRNNMNVGMRYIDDDHLFLLLKFAQTKELTIEAGKRIRGGFMERKNPSIIIRLITGEIKGIANFFLDSIVYLIMTIKIWISCYGKK